MPADSISPAVRGGLALGLIALGWAIPLTIWPAFGLLFAFIFLLQSLADIPVGELIRRYLLLFPLLGGMAVAVPLSQGFRHGIELGWLILLRGYLAFGVLFWLTRSVPLPELIGTLRRCRVPEFFLGLLTLFVRYSPVIWEEQRRVQRAMRSRVGSAGTRSRWGAAATVIGTVLVRSLDRADRIGRAMVARGWSGRWHG